MSLEDRLWIALSAKRKPVGNKLREQIYKQYWGYLMGVALRYISDQDMASMVVNDSFLKIFTHLDRFQCADRKQFKNALKGWMSKVTVRTALNAIRREKSRAHHEAQYDLQFTEISIVLPDHLHLDGIWDLIHALPDQYKNVFILYEVEGFNHDEIAALLGLSSSSSRVYLTRAKEQLRNLYRTLMT